MLDKIQRQQRFVEVDARNAMTGDVENTNGLPGDDMGVSIGNESHHYHPQKPSSPLLAAILGAAILAGGILAGIAAKHYFGDSPPVDTDTDTAFEPGFQ